jgi:hypothetical protein
MFLLLKNFKTAFTGNLRQWSSRRRHRCSVSKTERKMKDVLDIVSHGKQEMNEI